MDVIHFYERLRLLPACSVLINVRLLRSEQHVNSKHVVVLTYQVLKLD